MDVGFYADVVFRESTGVEVLLSENVTLIAINVSSLCTVVAMSTASPMDHNR